MIYDFAVPNKLTNARVICRFYETGSVVDRKRSGQFTSVLASLHGDTKVTEETISPD